MSIRKQLGAPVLGLILIAVSGLVVHPAAQAAFASGGLCSANAQTGGISTSDLTLNSAAANDCYGLVEKAGGNVDSADHVANLNTLGWGAFSADRFLKDDSGGVTETFLGMTWELDADVNQVNGAYTLTVTDNDLNNPPDIPFETDIVGVLKASTDAAYYLFRDVLIDTSNAGTFTISWTTGNNNSNPALSGLSLFIGEARQPGTPPIGTTMHGVPVSGTLLLLAAPLLALGLRYGRRA